MLGGIFYGTLSERIGRKKAIMIAAFLALPVLPLWAFSSGSFTIGLGAFLMQFMVQGARGVVPTAERAGSGECARRAAVVCLPTR